jgi:hypothetical protein
MEDMLNILVMVEAGILQTSNSLRLKHLLHSPFEKSVNERAMEYIKYRTEGFDDNYPCRKSIVDVI